MTDNSARKKFFRQMRKAYETMTPEQRKQEAEFVELLDNALLDGLEGLIPVESSG